MESGASIAIVVGLASLTPAATAAIRTMDPSGQEIDYGCGLSHPAGQAWVRASLPTAPGAVTPAATGNWSFAQTDYYGIGGSQIGSVLPTASVSFNGRQGRTNAGLREQTGPAIWQYIEVDAINNSTGRLADTTSGNAGHYDAINYTIPQWNPYYHSTSYYGDFNWYFSVLGTRNPSTQDGRCILLQFTPRQSPAKAACAPFRSSA